MTAPVSTNSRQVALDALIEIEADGAYANLRLGPLLQKSGLDERDRRLVTELVYGTIRRRRSLDYLVDRFLVADPAPPARAALRLGAYQLRFTDIPDHAAVSATVDIAPKRFRGMVNAVLRKVATAPVNWPDDATRLSYPDWIVDRLRADLGDDAALGALETMNRAPDVSVRDDGYTQDRSSQRVADALGVGDGDLVIDVCAAPGGKATALAAAGARVVAADQRAKRVGLLAGNIDRTAGGRSGDATVWPLVADARHPAIRPGVADAVLVDAPCSGLGVLRRRADARWRITADDVDRLSGIQHDILDASAGLVGVGGLLAYSVCTLTRAETLDVAERFAAEHPEFEPQPSLPEPWTPWGSGSLLLPQADDSDGMALFLWRRRTD
ncbi:MAG: transcription antitermination factor NusB [Acidimicrobiales bacterium]